MAGPTKYVGAVTRYAARGGFMSARDPFDDLVLHIEFLGAKDYVVELMTTTHSIREADATARAPRVRAHARLALLYLNQANAGPVEVSFVSGYYAILQLLKIYILFSDLHNQLPAQRHHGASYDPTGPFDRPFPEETVTLRQAGALQLFYRALTGRSIPANTIVAMGDVYPYMQDVSTEWEYSGGSSRICTLEPEVIYLPNQEVRARWRVAGPGVAEAAPQSHLPVLGTLEVDPAQQGLVFRSTGPIPTEPDAGAHLGGTLDRRYLYFPNQGKTISAVMSGALLMPEEFPIVLAFFHLGSVSRYHPEYLERLRDTRYWPVVAALRAHSMFKFLLLFWSYLRQAHVEISRD